MLYKLFLDDERLPIGEDWTVVKSFYEACNLVNKYGCPYFISFDHDLGGTKTGYDFAKFIIEMDLDGRHKIPDNFEFYVHSQNPIGKQNIEQLLYNYLEKRNGKDNIFRHRWTANTF